jgi:transposase
VISLPAGTRIWIAAGVTDMQCGFQGLAAKVQTALEEDPLGGNVYIFRGGRGDLGRFSLGNGRRNLASREAA